MSLEGFIGSRPEVGKITFPIRGKMGVHLSDGRVILVPLKAFPSIKKLDTKQRRKWQSLKEGFTFDDCDEAFHLEQILGDYQNYKHL